MTVFQCRLRQAGDLIHPASPGRLPVQLVIRYSRSIFMSRVRPRIPLCPYTAGSVAGNGQLRHAELRPRLQTRTEPHTSPGCGPTETPAPDSGSDTGDDKETLRGLCQLCRHLPPVIDLVAWNVGLTFARLPPYSSAFVGDIRPGLIIVFLLCPRSGSGRTCRCRHTCLPRPSIDLDRDPSLFHTDGPTPRSRSQLRSVSGVLARFHSCFPCRRSSSRPRRRVRSGEILWPLCQSVAGVISARLGWSAGGNRTARVRPPIDFCTSFAFIGQAAENER